MRSIAYGAHPIWQAKDVMQDISCNDPFDNTSPIIPLHTTMSPKDLLDKSMEVENKSIDHNPYHYPNETSLSLKPKWIDWSSIGHD